MAARHVANDEGSCSKTGDIYGNDIKKALERYYAFNYSELTILRVSSIDLGLPTN